MAKATRITLTSAQRETPEGRQLIELILAMCHDGQLDIGEVEGLHIFLRKASGCGIPAVAYLRAITREIVADGRVDGREAYFLKKAFERVVPKDVRGVVATHLESIGLPRADPEDAEPRWARDPATAAQVRYIIDLGGACPGGLTKGRASELIDGLMERRPPTPRQVMLLRFFDRLDLMGSTKDAVSEWIDGLYCGTPALERAWERFKRETGHDPFGADPSVVPVGAYVNYLDGPMVGSGSGDQEPWRRVPGPRRRRRAYLPWFVGLVMLGLVAAAALKLL